MKKFMKSLAILLVAFAVVACGSTTGTSAENIATVNGKEITYDDYVKNYTVFKKQIESSVGTEIWTQDAGDGKTYMELFKAQILDKLIDDSIIREEAAKENIVVETSEVDANLKEFNDQLAGNQEYATFLKENNITDEFMRKQIESDAIIKKFKEDYNAKNPVKEEDIKSYYDANTETYNLNEVEASHILIKTVDENFAPLSEDAQNAAKAKAEDLLIRAKEGEDFAKLAEENSEDTASAVNGGDLGYFAKGVMVKEFEDAAFSLEPGQISDLIQTTYGYHIIKVTNKKNEIMPFEEVQDKIKLILEDESYQNYLNELRSSAKIEKNEELLNKE